MDSSELPRTLLDVFYEWVEQEHGHTKSQFDNTVACHRQVEIFAEFLEAHKELPE